MKRQTTSNGNSVKKFFEFQIFIGKVYFFSKNESFVSSTSVGFPDKHKLNTKYKLKCFGESFACFKYWSSWENCWLLNLFFIAFSVATNVEEFLFSYRWSQKPQNCLLLSKLVTWQLHFCQFWASREDFTQEAICYSSVLMRTNKTPN